MQHGADTLHGGGFAIAQMAIAVLVEGVGEQLSCCDVSNGHGLLHVVLRLNANDNLAPAIVAVAAAADALLARRQVRQVVVAVAQSAPSPVDMVEAVAVVAVAHKGVASLAVGTADVDGAPLGQFVVDELVPLVVARSIADIADTVAEAKIVAQ